MQRKTITLSFGVGARVHFSNNNRDDIFRLVRFLKDINPNKLGLEEATEQDWLEF